jgi:hypothetical protein
LQKKINLLQSLKDQDITKGFFFHLRKKHESNVYSFSPHALHVRSLFLTLLRLEILSLAHISNEKKEKKVLFENDQVSSRYKLHEKRVISNVFYNFFNSYIYHNLPCTNKSTSMGKRSKLITKFKLQTFVKIIKIFRIGKVKSLYHKKFL